MPLIASGDGRSTQNKQCTHLGFMDRQGLLFQHQPFRPPEPAGKPILLDADHPIPDNMGIKDSFGIAIWRSANPRV